MTLKLLSTNVVKFWDLIKYALNQVERIGDTESLGVYNRLFAQLLSDKAQCFISYAESGEVQALCITELRFDEVMARKSLHLRCLYAFKSASNEEWAEKFQLIKEFAKAEKCDLISFETSNPRIRSISKEIGAVEKSVNMVLEV